MKTDVWLEMLSFSVSGLNSSPEEMMYMLSQNEEIKRFSR